MSPPLPTTAIPSIAAAAEPGSACAAALDALGIALPARDALWVLSHVATERRLLLVGDPGQGKTLLARRLGAALAGDAVACLDAALTSFDDVRGFVRPASLDRGVVEVVPGPWSPYDAQFLFVDELSRANAWQQGRWLQLVHDRRVDGRATAIRWVVCAMNPATGDGSAPLTVPLADRFHAAVELTPFSRLTPAQRLWVAAGLPTPGAGTEANVRELVARIAASTAAVTADASTRLRLAGVAVAAVEQLNEAARGAGLSLALHGRRVVHIRESLESLAGAIHAEQEGTLDGAVAELRPRLRDVVEATLGGVLRAAEQAEAELDQLLDAAWRGAITAWDDAYDVRVTAVDPAEQRRALAELEVPRLPAEDAVRLLGGYWRAADGVPTGVAPVAVLQRDLGDAAAPAADAFLSLLKLRPAYVAALDRVPAPLRASLPPTIHSTALFDQFALRCQGGVYHPQLPAASSAPDRPIVVFTRPTPPWRALVEAAAPVRRPA